MTKPKCHVLKVWPKLFGAILCGAKKFEFRKNDRDYRRGDNLILKEFDPDVQAFTGAVTFNKVGYIVYGPDFGIPEGYCVFSLDNP